MVVYSLGGGDSQTKKTGGRGKTGSYLLGVKKEIRLESYTAGTFAVPFRVLSLKKYIKGDSF